MDKELMGLQDEEPLSIESEQVSV